MTNKEEQEVVRSVFRAYINDLKAHSTKIDRPTFKMLEEVKDKAIKALEQQPYDEDFIHHKKEVLERIAKREREIDKYIKELEALEQQPCEDCISRQAVLNIFDEWFATCNMTDKRESPKAKINALPPVTPRASEEDIHREREQAYMLGYEDASKRFRTEPCEDAISRSDLLQKIQEAPTHLNETWDELYDSVIDDINSMPSVIPKYTDEEIDKIQEMEQAYVDKMVELAVEETKRPKGKWIDDCGGVKCSCCGYSIDDDHYAKAYCTNCGAEMSGGVEDET